MNSNYKEYQPYVSPNDPCEPMKTKSYSTPPHLYMGFQPPHLPQFSPMDALRAGTLWKAFYDPYYSPHENKANVIGGEFK